MSYFSYLFAKAWTACTLDRSRESSNPFVSFRLNRKQFSFSIHLFVGTLYQLEDFLVCWEFLLWMCVESLSDTFCVYRSDHMVFLLYFVMRANERDCLSNVRPTLHSWDSPYFLMMYYSFIYCWILFAVISLRNFASISMKDSNF